MLPPVHSCQGDSEKQGHMNTERKKKLAKRLANCRLNHPALGEKKIGLTNINQVSVM